MNANHVFFHVIFQVKAICLFAMEGPMAGGGPYKFPQVDWLLPVHGPLHEVEARA